MRKFASGSTSRNQKTTCANSASGIHCPRDEERLLLLVQLLVSTQNWARGEFVAKATKRKDSTHSQAEWVFCFGAKIFRRRTCGAAMAQFTTDFITKSNSFTQRGWR